MTDEKMGALLVALGRVSVAQAQVLTEFMRERLDELARKGAEYERTGTLLRVGDGDRADAQALAKRFGIALPEAGDDRAQADLFIDNLLIGEG